MFDISEGTWFTTVLGWAMMIMFCLGVVTFVLALWVGAVVVYSAFREDRVVEVCRMDGGARVCWQEYRNVSTLRGEK